MKNIFRSQLIILLSKSSILVGGQAVIEGVMMRVPGFIATAVRNPEGEIIVQRKPFDTIVKKYPYLNLPILRGAISLFESMKMGFSTIQWSANIAFPEEAKKQNKILDFFITIASLALAISLFIWLPLATATWFAESVENAFQYNLIAGIVRITIFLIYLIFISYTKDAKRLFEYHGAEHKVVYTFENGDDLNVDNAGDSIGIIVIDVDQKSQAYKNNLRKGDIITEVGKKQINSIEDYLNELENYSKGDPIMLRVIRDGNPRYEAFEIR